MPSSVVPGQQVTPTLLVLDNYGSPVTTGVSGTMSLYGPLSATVALDARAIVHTGGGRWGNTFAGTTTATRGTYRFLVPTLTVGPTTLFNQGGAFTVGESDAWTLRQCYTSVRQALDDGFVGTSDASGNANLLTDSAFNYGSSNRWVSSELFIFQPQNPADRNPVRVTAFAAGGFGFVPAITATVAGQDYILGNIEGRGWRHERVMDAIVTACRRQRTLVPVWDAVSLVSSLTQFEYAPPAGWVSVDGVEYRSDANYPDRWSRLANRYARWQPATRTIRLTMPALRNLTGGYSWSIFPAASNPLRIVGRALSPVPGAMGDLLPGDGATIRDDAVYELLLQSPAPEHRQRAAMMQPAVQRSRAGAAVVRLSGAG